MSKLDIAKNVILRNYSDGDCGLFFCRNSVDDDMTTIYEDDELTINICYDYCYDYAYFEVFGLDITEESELEDYYMSLQSWKK